MLFHIFNVDVYPKNWTFSYYAYSIHCSLATICFLAMVNIACLSHDEYIYIPISPQKVATFVYTLFIYLFILFIYLFYYMNH